MEPEKRKTYREREKEKENERKKRKREKGEREKAKERGEGSPRKKKCMIPARSQSTTVDSFVMLPDTKVGQVCVNVVRRDQILKKIQ